MGSGYVPPKRHRVTGKLLNINYDECCRRNEKELKEEVDTFGLSFLGDGAMIKKIPFINIIGVGATLFYGDIGGDELYTAHGFRRNERCYIYYQQIPSSYTKA